MNVLTTVTLLALSILPTSTAQSSSNCTTFDWDRQPPYLTTLPPKRVSAALSCPPSATNRSCTLTASGDELFSASKNLSISSFIIGTARDLLIDSVQASVDPNTLLAPFFNASIIVPVDRSAPLEPGKSGYLNFTAHQFCYSGSVGSCQEGSEVRNGAAIEICAPLWREVGDDGEVVDGEYEVVEIDEGDVEKFRDPYAGQVRADEGGAGNVMAGVSYLGLAAAVGVAVFAV